MSKRQSRMLEKGKISPSGGELLVITLNATSILLVPSFTVKQLDKMPGWPSWEHYGSGYPVLVYWLGQTLGKQFSSTIALLGRWLGKAVGLVYMQFLRYWPLLSGNSFMTASFTNTALVFSSAWFFGGLVCYAAWKL